MRQKSLQKIVLCIALSVVALIGIALLTLSAALYKSALTCEATQKTLEERTLNNGDSIRVRFEPDCSWTGGPLVFLYIRHYKENNYRQTTYWRGDTTDEFSIHLETQTPIILTSNRQVIVLRSDAAGWRSTPLVSAINGALPDQYPLLRDGFATLDAFNPESGELTASVNWGGNYRQLTLHLVADSAFEFIRLDPSENQPWLQLNLNYAPPLRAMIERKSEDDPDPLLAIDIMHSGTKPERLGVFPMWCDMAMEERCVSTRVLMSHPGMSKHPRVLQMPLKLAIGWLVGSRQYATALYVRTKDRFEAVSLQPLISDLSLFKQVQWSVQPLDNGIRQVNDSEFMRLLVSPVEPGPPFHHQPANGAVIQPHVIEQLCQSYVVTIDLDFNTVPAELDISDVEFEAGSVMCQNQPLPSL